MPHHSTPELDGTGHPYVRISHPEQRKGGGLERQTKADLEAFCSRFGLTLSKQMRIDDGVSAFNGLNASPNHELGKFLEDARRGVVVRPGDCLILENYDRLSRQNPWAAIGLVNDLRQLKIHVGRLDRMKLLRYDSDDPGDFFEAAMEFNRGHSESATKSYRNGDAWDRKRKAAREKRDQPPRRGSGRVSRALTNKLPAWVREVNGVLELIPERAAVVRLIFDLAAQGRGYHLIVKYLSAMKVPPFTGSQPVLDSDGRPVLHVKGRRQGKPKLRALPGLLFGAGQWTIPYISRILNDGRALGDYQPCGKGRKPEGDPIKGYYPKVIEKEQFWAAQAGVNLGRSECRLSERRPRVGKHVNLFSGLLRNARDGDSYITTYKPLPVLQTRGSEQGQEGCKSYSFPAPVFERVILARLREIDPHDILNGSRPDEAAPLAAELTAVEASIALLGAEMDEHGESPTLFRRLRDKEARQRELTQLLAEARERAAHPLSESWGEMGSLIDALDSDPSPPDRRIRLRAVLRRVVAEIWLLVIPVAGKAERLCAVQIAFAGSDKRREYAILHRQAQRNRKAETSAVTLAQVVDGTFEMSKRADARRLLADLTRAVVGTGD